MSFPGRSDEDEVKRAKGRYEEGLTDSEPKKQKRNAKTSGA
jgi:hypothetical protein